MAEPKSKGKTLSPLGFSLPKVEKTTVPSETAERFLAAVPEAGAAPVGDGKGRARKPAKATRKNAEPPNASQKERLTVYLPLELAKRLDRMGAEERYSRSALIEQAVEALVSEWERGKS